MTITTTAEIVVADGLAIPKVIHKLLKEDGGKEEAAAMITMIMTTGMAADNNQGEVMMMTGAAVLNSAANVVGLATRKDIHVHQKEAGKTVKMEEAAAMKMIAVEAVAVMTVNVEMEAVRRMVKDVVGLVIRKAIQKLQNVDGSKEMVEWDAEMITGVEAEDDQVKMVEVDAGHRIMKAAAGLEIRKDMLKQRNSDGNIGKEEWAVMMAEAMAGAVAGHVRRTMEEAAVVHKMMKAVAGSETQKVMQKQQN